MFSSSDFHTVTGIVMFNTNQVHIAVAKEGDWRPAEKLVFHSGEWVKMTTKELQEHGYPKHVIEEAILADIREDEEVIEDDIID